MRHGAKTSTSLGKVPTRASLRRVLSLVVRTDADLEAFCLDHFPEVAGRFGNNMERTVKWNLLLKDVATDEILEALQQEHPEELAEVQHLLVFGDGSDALPTALLDARERRNRQRMIDKVRKFWVEGVLEQSLHNAVLIELGKAYRCDAVPYPWDMVQRPLEREPQPIPKSKKMIELFGENHCELLILGPPGCGKTTMLLDLCRDLLQWAEADDSEPIPVVFNLSSWAAKGGPLAAWLEEELHLRYNIPRVVAEQWLAADALLPLLDGLDEVVEDQRAACVAAINQMCQQRSVPGLVVCSRSADYQELAKKLRLHTAIVLSTMTQAQTDAYLSELGPAAAPLQALFRDDPRAPIALN